VEKSKYQDLQREVELLKADKDKTTSELNEMLSTVNEIQESIDSIREAENYLNIQSGEVNQSTREKIKQNMLLIAETLKTNREQLNALQDKLKKSDIKSAELQKTINRINNELNQKAEMIVMLQEELTKKDIHIKELDEHVNVLTEHVSILSETTATQSEQLTLQDKELNRAYYCCGTRRELKEQSILTGGGLFSRVKALQGTFNKDYFKEIDIRDVKEFQLFDKKAKVRSNHPTGSYELIKDSDGNLVLRILDIEQFWQTGRYLVVEIG
jgi:predicted nuclease with TOPRIM domain